MRPTPDPARSRPTRLSLKWRLLGLVSAVALLGLILSSVSVVENGRDAIRAEGDNFARFAVSMLQRATATPGRFGPEALDELIQALDGMRHVRIVREPAGPGAIPRENLREPAAPPWFAWLMLVGQPPFFARKVPNGPGGDTLRVMADPADEIDELWADIAPLLWIGATLLLGVSALLYAGVRRSLSPLDDLAQGLKRVERADFSEHVSEDVVRELHPIHQRFNWMSDVLQQTMRDNRKLAQSMVVLREEERLHLARELHDEFSPTVFSVKMNLAGAIEAGDTSTRRLETIADTVAELEQSVRRMLGWLRSAALDELGLETALQDLVQGWRKHLDETDWRLDIAGDVDALDDTVSITGYRLVQECLTNAAKHAHAGRVDVRVSRIDDKDGDRLVIVVEDDGVGMSDDGGPDGFGLRGMGERVRALGGSLALLDGAHGGLRVHAEIPVAVAGASPDDASAPGASARTRLGK